MIREVEAIWNDFFANDPLDYVFLHDVYYHLYQSDMRIFHMIFIFSALAIIIAMLGLFGLSMFAIERRTKEIGIRKVMGASVLSIVYQLTREFLVLVTIAIAIAIPISWWTMNRWLEHFAYRIHICIWIFVSGVAITLAIALLSIGNQAIKAATENPVKAIKMES